MPAAKFAWEITLLHLNMSRIQSNDHAAHCLFVGILDRLVIRFHGNKLKSRLLLLQYDRQLVETNSTGVGLQS